MASVVFLRAANVGKHNRFQPGVFVRELAKFGVVNIGAVGTFVVRETVSAATFRAALLRKLPFKCDVVICSAKEILELAETDPFCGERSDDIEAYVTLMAKPPASVPKLPIYAPSQQNWEV